MIIFGSTIKYWDIGFFLCVFWNFLCIIEITWTNSKKSWKTPKIGIATCHGYLGSILAIFHLFTQKILKFLPLNYFCFKWSCIVNYKKVFIDMLEKFVSILDHAVPKNCFQFLYRAVVDSLGLVWIYAKCHEMFNKHVDIWMSNHELALEVWHSLMSSVIWVGIGARY